MVVGVVVPAVSFAEVGQPVEVLTHVIHVPGTLHAFSTGLDLTPNALFMVPPASFIQRPGEIVWEIQRGPKEGPRELARGSEKSHVVVSPHQRPTIETPQIILQTVSEVEFSEVSQEFIRNSPPPTSIVALINLRRACSRKGYD